MEIGMQHELQLSLLVDPRLACAVPDEASTLFETSKCTVITNNEDEAF